MTTISRNPEQRTSATETIQQYGLEQQAIDMALSQQPTARDVGLSLPEQQVREGIEHGIISRSEDLKSHQGSILADIDTASTPPVVSDVPNLKHDFTAAIVECFRDAALHIKDVVSSNKQRDAECRAFRLKHGLKHKPDYPVSPLKHWAMVLAVALIETALNTGLFVPQSDQGLIGAFGMAGLFAATNVAVAAFTGFVPLRYLRHTNPVHKRWAIPVSIMTSITVVFIACYAAHFRQLIGTNTELTAGSVVQHMLTQPFSVSFHSWALFLATILFALFAAFKGYRASDYPGYAHVHKQLMQAEADSQQLQAQLVQQIDHHRDHAVGQLEQPVQQYAALAERITRSIQAFDVRRDRYRDLDRADVTAANDAIQHFRSLNLATRTDGVTPPSFAIPLDFTAHMTANQSFADLRSHAEPVVAKQKQLSDAVAERRQMIVSLAEHAKDHIAEIINRVEASFVDEHILPTAKALRQALALDQDALPLTPQTELRPDFVIAGAVANTPLTQSANTSDDHLTDREVA